MSWTIVNNHIAIQDKDKIAHLEAEDVYKAFKYGRFEFNNQEQGNIEEAFPNIIWSKVSKYAKVEIFHNDNIEIKVSVDGADVDFVSSKILDQIILDNTWHYIENAK